LIIKKPSKAKRGFVFYESLPGFVWKKTNNISPKGQKMEKRPGVREWITLIGGILLYILILKAVKPLTSFDAAKYQFYKGNFSLIQEKNPQIRMQSIKNLKGVEIDVVLDEDKCVMDMFVRVPEKNMLFLFSRSLGGGTGKFKNFTVFDELRPFAGSVVGFNKELAEQAEAIATAYEKDPGDIKTIQGFANIFIGIVKGVKFNRI
jgi:hypothetical protein